MFQLLSKSINLIFAAAVALAFSSCGHSKPQIQGGNADPVRVKTMLTGTADAVSVSDTYSGTIEAGSSTDLSFSVAGTVTGIYVKEGQKVTKGQKIASLDGTSLKNAYEIALATLREAQDAHSRMKRLHDAQALPDMQWVAVQEQLKQAEAAAAIARKAMNDAYLIAPSSGVVAHKLADVGQTVAPGLPVVQVMDVNTLNAKISVPEADLGRIADGATANVTAGGRAYTATLAEKAVDANILSRNYAIKFRIDKPDGNLLPGMICSVGIDGAAPEAGSTTTEIALPPQAVVLDFDNTHYVWIKKDGLAERREVTVGGLDSRGIIVTAGITATDSVIVEGQQKLSSGLKVVSVN